MTERELLEQLRAERRAKMASFVRQLPLGLTREQSAWLTAEADRTGDSEGDLVRAALDAVIRKALEGQ